MKLWLTRPLADSAEFAAQLAAEGIESIIAPVMRIESREIVLDQRPDGILITSRHAVHALPDDWRDLPVFCVGSASAEAVAARGYHSITQGDADGLHLLPRVTERMAAGSRMLYLSGEETRYDMASLLAANSIAVERVVAYDAIATTELAPQLRLALEAGEVNGAAFFSPRSARLACQLLKQEEFTASAPRMDAFCLSLQVAEAAAMLPWRSLQSCHRPTRDAMFALVSGYARSVAS